jgi:hypothetical protein
MSSESVQHITELLRAAQAGDAAAAERLLAVVYEQLHRLARARMAQLPPGQTLQPTALPGEKQPAPLAPGKPAPEFVAWRRAGPVNGLGRGVPCRVAGSHRRATQWESS